MCVEFAIVERDLRDFQSKARQKSHIVEPSMPKHWKEISREKLDKSLLQSSLVAIFRAAFYPGMGGVASGRMSVWIAHRVCIAAIVCLFPAPPEGDPRDGPCTVG